MLLRMTLRMTTMRRICSFALALASLPLAAQQSAPRLNLPTAPNSSGTKAAESAKPELKPSATARQMSLFAVVRDKHGKPVGDLTPGDFVLEHNGKTSSITQLSPGGDWPLTLGIIAETSPGESKALSAERDEGSAFLKRMLRSSSDRAFVLHFDRQVELLQDVTASQSKLERGIGRISAGEQERPAKDADESQPRFFFGGNTLYDAIFLSADEVLRGWGERTALVVFSSGVDRQSKVTLQRAIEAAQRSGTPVYCVYVASKDTGRGNDEKEVELGGGLPGGTRPRSPFPGGYPGGYPGGGGPLPGGGIPVPRQTPHKDEPKQVDGRKILQQIAQETGGGYFEMKKNKHAKQIFEQIEEQLRHQYRLSFTSETAGSGYQRLQVTTRNRDQSVQAPGAVYVE